MKKKPSLDEMLAECDISAPMPDMKDWLSMPDVGFEKIYLEDLEDYDTPASLIDDERVIDFLRDIVKKRDPALLDHAVSFIKRRWKKDSELKASTDSNAAGVLKGLPINDSVSDEESLQSSFASEIEAKHSLENPKNSKRLLEDISEIEAGISKKRTVIK